jgi:uroporphyrinogen decarboxylase
MNERENRLRAARFERPDHIPLTFHVSGACWTAYPREALQELMATHPLLFPGFVKTPPAAPDHGKGTKAGERYVDPWGCVIETTEDGIGGSVTEHPLADWAALDRYTPPDPAAETDWSRVARIFAEAKAAGRFASASLPHGHTFLRLCDLRGFENALMDMMDGDPRIVRLLGMIEEYNAFIVKRHLEFDTDWMGYPEDLGAQVGPMISPDLFRRYIKPCYRRLIAPAREAGYVIHMHSDGDLHDLIDDILDAGVTVINLQDTVNGLDWIKARLAGKVCIDLDIDRQDVTRFGTPAQIDAHIRRAVALLGGRQGGLMMIYGWYPGIPIENVKALMDAMERYAVPG